jgi:multidrug efflux pump
MIIEEALAGLEGVEAMTSNSSTGESKVSLEFVQDRNLDAAANDVRDRLSRYRSRLPQDGALTEPTLSKAKGDDRPIIYIAVTSKKRTTAEIKKYVEDEALDKMFESIASVGRVETHGSDREKVKIIVDPKRLQGHGITVQEFLNAIRRQCVEKPAGTLRGSDREYLVTIVANLEKPEEFENMVIMSKNNRLIRIRDVGRVEMSSDDKRTKTHYNGETAISLSIYKQAGANPIDIAKQVKKELERVKKTLPEDLNIEVAYDSTEFIERSIDLVYKTILEATLLVILVVFLFLRSARASMIPLVTIPVSLIGSLFLMYVLEFSINVFTLMAMVLAIGLVVDDAIVVLENIYKYLEKGDKPYVAAFKGIREISFAVIAMTLTLAAVYTPVALAKGMTGKLLTEFSITLAGSVIISGFVALTLSPMMCSRLLVAHEEKRSKKNLWTRFKNLIRTDILLEFLERTYEESLDYLLRRRKFLLTFIAFAFTLLGGTIFFFLPSEMTPREDRGFISIDGTSPQSATREFTDRYIMQLDATLAQIPEVERRVINITNPTYSASIQLRSERKRSTQEVVDELKKKLYNTAIGIEVTNVSSGSDALGGTPVVNLVVRANKGHREMKELTSQLVQALHQTGIVSGITSESQADVQDYVINIKRDRAGELNIDIQSISETIEALMRGQKVKQTRIESKLHDINVEVDPESRKSPTDITNLSVKSEHRKQGQKEEYLVPLSELVEIVARPAPRQIHRHDRMHAVSVNVWLKPSVSLGEGIKMVESVAKEAIPEDARFDFIGETKRYLTESNTMLLVFGLALAFIYFVMAAQFESWRDPLIIMLSVPLSVSGALVTLGLIPEGSLNLYSNIGMVTLIGLITKHGILMVEFANALRDEGKEKLEAIVQACRARLRPILMTTFAMVLGSIPLAIATGEGSERLRQIGWTVVGGMSIGTLFTLFVIPVFYLYITPKKRKTHLQLAA